MSRNALTLVFPAAVCLLVCSLVALFLTATGLEPGPLLVAAPAPAGQLSDSARWAAADSLRLVAQRQLAVRMEGVTAGDALFKGNCAQCHAVNDVVVGPALAGIDKRRPLPWIIKWVKNSSRVIASGDAYGVKIFNEYQKQQMPSFPDLKDEEIESIVLYLRSQEGSTGVVAIVD
jgi:mono/diheme cytochrome c family protein